MEILGSCKDFLVCPMEMFGCPRLMLLFHREELGSSKKILDRTMEMLGCLKDILISGRFLNTLGRCLMSPRNCLGALS